MGKKKDLSQGEKAEIVQNLANGMKTIDIAKKIKRDHRTIKNFVNNSNAIRTRSDKGLRRKVTMRELRRIKKELIRHPCLSSKRIFANADAAETPRTSRCRILQEMAVIKKPSIRPPLRETHKQKRVEWAHRYLKQDFQAVIFTDECRATLDGPDGWSSGWTLRGASRPQRMRRQQGGGGVMFWAGIVKDELIGPFRVPDGIKMTSVMYVQFLKENFIPWLKKKSRAFKMKMVFMHDNAPSHAAKNTIESLDKLGIKKEKIMIWPAVSPDLNPIENLWATLKRMIYQDGRQYSSNLELWEAIRSVASKIDKETIQTLTNSMDERLTKVIAKKGSYINM